VTTAAPSSSYDWAITHLDEAGHPRGKNVVCAALLTTSHVQVVIIITLREGRRRREFAADPLNGI